jgi:hypothetical protein
MTSWAFSTQLASHPVSGSGSILFFQEINMDILLVGPNIEDAMSTEARATKSSCHSLHFTDAQSFYHSSEQAAAEIEGAYRGAFILL